MALAPRFPAGQRRRRPGPAVPRHPFSLATPEAHRMQTAVNQMIRVTVRPEPARAGIDPRPTLIDREYEDNVVAVKAAGTDPIGGIS